MTIDALLTKYDNTLLIGYFTSSVDDSHMKSLKREPNCFKNLQNPSCIDLTLGNRPQSFNRLEVIEKGLSDFLKIITTIMKTHFSEAKPLVLSDQSYKSFENVRLIEDLWYAVNI